MSTVEQRVDPLNSDAVLDSHELTSPSSVIETALDLEQGHSTDSDIERVIQAERSRIQEKHGPIPPSPEEAPKIRLSIEVEAAPRQPEIPTEKVFEPAIEAVPARAVEPKSERSQEPQIIEQLRNAESKQEKPSPVLEAQPVIQKRIEPEKSTSIQPRRQVRQIENPEPAIETDQKVETRPLPIENPRSPVESAVAAVEAQQPEPSAQVSGRQINAEPLAPAQRLEQQVEKFVEPAAERTIPALSPSLEEKIEKIRAELNIKAPAIEYDFKTEQPREIPVHKNAPDTKPHPIQERDFEPELLMEERQTLTLEQAMKFDFASAKIGLGQKAPQLTFRGHGFGSGSMLDKLVTYLADFIKRLEMKLILFLTRRRIDRKTRSVKVVSAEEEDNSLSLESFSRSLSKERKRRRLAFFRLPRFSRMFSRFSK